MPFFDVVGNTGGVAFRHCSAMAVKVGTVLALIVTVFVPDALQPPLLVTVTERVTEPDMPAVYLILAVPLPELIVPPEIAHV